MVRKIIKDFAFLGVINKKGSLNNWVLIPYFFILSEERLRRCYRVSSF